MPSSSTSTGAPRRPEASTPPRCPSCPGPTAPPASSATTPTLSKARAGGSAGASPGCAWTVRSILRSSAGCCWDTTPSPVSSWWGRVARRYGRTRPAGKGRRWPPMASRRAAHPGPSRHPSGRQRPLPAPGGDRDGGAAGGAGRGHRRRPVAPRARYYLPHRQPRRGWEALAGGPGRGGALRPGAQGAATSPRMHFAILHPGCAPGWPPGWPPIPSATTTSTPSVSPAATAASPPTRSAAAWLTPSASPTSWRPIPSPTLWSATAWPRSTTSARGWAPRLMPGSTSGCRGSARGGGTRAGKAARPSRSRGPARVHQAALGPDALGSQGPYLAAFRAG
jgi:hypothetical protein